MGNNLTLLPLNQASKASINRRMQPSNTSGLNHQSGEKTKYLPTQLGLGCLASSLSPDEALTVFTELQKARKSFVLENELHIIYQVTIIALTDTLPKFWGCNKMKNGYLY